MDTMIAVILGAALALVAFGLEIAHQRIGLLTKRIERLERMGPVAPASQDEVTITVDDVA